MLGSLSMSLLLMLLLAGQTPAHFHGSGHVWLDQDGMSCEYIASIESQSLTPMLPQYRTAYRYVLGRVTPPSIWDTRCRFPQGAFRSLVRTFVLRSGAVGVDIAALRLSLLMTPEDRALRRLFAEGVFGATAGFGVDWVDVRITTRSDGAIEILVTVPWDWN